MIGVSEFCKQPFMRTESVCTNVLLDGQFWKKDASVSFNLRTNYF